MLKGAAADTMGAELTEFTEVIMPAVLVPAGTKLSWVEAACGLLCVDKLWTCTALLAAEEAKGEDVTKDIVT